MSQTVSERLRAWVVADGAKVAVLVTPYGKDEGGYPALPPCVRFAGQDELFYRSMGAVYERAHVGVAEVLA